MLIFESIINFYTIIHQLVCWFVQKAINFCDFCEKWRKAEYVFNNGFFQPTMEIWFGNVPGAISQQNKSKFALFISLIF